MRNTSKAFAAACYLILFLATSAQVRVDVWPRMAVVNPYKRLTFRFRFQIEPSEFNRLYTLEYSCGGELHRAQRELDGHSARTTDRIVNLTVLGDCQFQVCLIKEAEGKQKTVCSTQTVHAIGGSP